MNGYEDVLKGYLEKTMHVIAYEYATLINLLLDIQLFQTLLQGGKEGAISRSELLPD